MKIVALLASPRRGGNSDTIARRFLETAEELDAQTQTFILNEEGTFARINETYAE